MVLMGGLVLVVEVEVGDGVRLRGEKIVVLVHGELRFGDGLG